MSEPTERIAEVLKAHAFVEYGLCSCGALIDDHPVNYDWDARRAHIAEAVAAAMKRWWAVREIELVGQVAIANLDLKTERRHADNWQKLAGRYDDIRYALRNAEDTPGGHAEFYRECAELIFGETS